MAEGVRDMMIRQTLSNWLEMGMVEEQAVAAVAVILQELTNQELSIALLSSHKLLMRGHRPMYYPISGERICLN